MTDYWTSDSDNAIKDYYYSTTTADKNAILNKRLCKTLYEMARRAMTSLGLKPEMEKQQDIVVHLVTKTLPKLKEDKLKGALQYLWTSAVNYTRTYILKPDAHTHITLESPCCYYSADDVLMAGTDVRYVRVSVRVEPVDLDEAYDKKLLQKKVLDEIDGKLKGQHVVNATNSVFLLLLKQYLIDNDFEVRGFGAYIRETMNLSLSTYRAIAGRLGFRTKDFNEEK